MKMRNIFNSPDILLVLAAFFWSGNFIVGRFVREIIPPIGLSFWRWFFASLIIFFIARPHLKRDWKQIRKNFPLLFLLSFMSVATFNPLIYSGLHWTTSLNAFLLQAVMPVLIVFMAFIFFREKILPLQGAGVVLSLIGACTIIVHGDWKILQALSVNRGDLLIFIAVAFYAGYSILMRKSPSIHPLSFATVTFAAGTLTLLPVYIWESVYIMPMPLTASSVLAVGYAAIFPSIISYMSYNRAVELTGATRAGMYVYLMPVFGSLMAMVFLGESFEWFHLVGIILIIPGILLVTRMKKK
jgi:drug/metabolite transporter (DMT)-like permease